jgi:hypothetical protein
MESGFLFPNLADTRLILGEGKGNATYDVRIPYKEKNTLIRECQIVVLSCEFIGDSERPWDVGGARSVCNVGMERSRSSKQVKDRLPPVPTVLQLVYTLHPHASVHRTLRQQYLYPKHIVAC